MSTGGNIPRRFSTPKKPPQKKAVVSKSTNASKNANDDYPKGALSAYMIWFRESRESIREGSKVKNLQKAAKFAWKKLEDKSEWEQKAKEDKERYQREMEEFNSKNGSADK
uniref:HMG box domain-containing protein n=1 Tax=Panagrolaimus superbus TaxID=310955 RepID=A0A914YFC9_9BILA